MSALVVAGDVSGTCTLQAPSAAGSTVLTLPVIAADTLAGIAATQTLTNKTLVAPALGTPASGVLTNCTGTVNALNAGLGVNQTWGSQTRSIGTTYTNSTGKPIIVAITATNSLASAVQGLNINGVAVYASGTSTVAGALGFSLVVPDGATYVTITNSGVLTLVTWYELR